MPFNHSLSLSLIFVSQRYVAYFYIDYTLFFFKTLLVFKKLFIWPVWAYNAIRLPIPYTIQWDDAFKRSVLLRGYIFQFRSKNLSLLCCFLFSALFSYRHKFVAGINMNISQAINRPAECKRFFGRFKRHFICVSNRRNNSCTNSQI